jgi:hypothetical protein
VLSPSSGLKSKPSKSQASVKQINAWKKSLSLALAACLLLAWLTRQPGTWGSTFLRHVGNLLPELRRHILGRSNYYSRRCQNLKSNLQFIFFIHVYKATGKIIVLCSLSAVEIVSMNYLYYEEMPLLLLLTLWQLICFHVTCPLQHERNYSFRTMRPAPRNKRAQAHSNFNTRIFQRRCL